MLLLNYILSVSRFSKRLISIFIDSLFIVIAFVAAFFTRLNDISVLQNPDYWLLVSVLIISTLIIFTKVGLYRAILRYLSLNALLTITLSCIASAFVLVASAYYLELFLPRSVPIIFVTYLMFLCGGSRLFVKIGVANKLSKKKVRVLIYGAGSSGRQLFHLLKQGDDYHPLAFIDDQKKLQKTVVHGLTIYPNKSLAHLIKKYHVTKIILAMPSATKVQRKLAIDSLLDLPIEVLSIPKYEDILDGTASIDQLRDVAVDELLGRDSVPAKPELLSANITNKVVMVTGSGGSIGSELCRQIVKEVPSTLILFDVSEFALYQIDKELSELVIEQKMQTKIIPLLGTVQHKNGLLSALNSFHVQTLYHAAAYKHVPLVEYNVVEGIRNNVFGTYYTALAAIQAKVETFVLISTDKAVRPTNIMGTTKRMAELALQSLAAEKSSTRFSMVRFGNVLGSSGSVIPLFKKQIKEGSHLTITHPEIIRYFMTIPEAAQLVIQAGAMGKGGDVFVLDMGEPVKIVDLAESLIKLSGLEVKNTDNPDGDIEIKFTGLRPGEKLFEELLVGDNVSSTEHERILSAQESFLPYSEYKEILNDLEHACFDVDHETIRELLTKAPTGFNPTDGIGDLVWQAGRVAS